MKKLMKALYTQHHVADRSQYGYVGIEITFLKKICLSELNVVQTNKPVLLMELLLKSVQTGDPYSRYITYMYMYTMLYLPVIGIAHVYVSV